MGSSISSCFCTKPKNINSNTKNVKLIVNSKLKVNPNKLNSSLMNNNNIYRSNHSIIKTENNNLHTLTNKERENDTKKVKFLLKNSTINNNHYNQLNSSRENSKNKIKAPFSKEDRYKRQLNEDISKGNTLKHVMLGKGKYKASENKGYQPDYNNFGITQSSNSGVRAGNFHIQFKAQKCERLIMFWIPAQTKVSFKVSGHWSIDKDYFGETNEKGYSTEITNEIHNGFNLGCLLGRVLGTNKYFNITNQLEIVSDISGPIFLSNESF